MKIGLISDIHADFSSLARALEFLDMHGAEAIVCAGDLVGKGQQAQRVIDCIRQRAIPCVQGNHDAMHVDIQEIIREAGDPSDPDYMRVALSDAALDHLRALPLTLRLEYAGKHVVLAHGVPWSNDEYLYPYSDADKFKRVARLAAADVIVLGHTHEPMIAHVGDVWIINPGSVCRRYAEGSGTCAILTLPSGNAHVYDIDTHQRVRAEYVEH